AHGPLRRERREGGRAGGGREAQGGLRRHRPPGEVVTWRGASRDALPAVRPSQSIPQTHEENTMSTTQTWTVARMTCGHCVSSVSEELSELTGVEKVDVDLPTGAVTVTSASALTDDAVRAAVEEAGYTVAESPS